MDDVLKTALSLIERGGPTAIAAIMAVMWFLERQNRIALQDKLEKVLERVIVAMEGTASSIREFRLLHKIDGQNK